MHTRNFSRGVVVVLIAFVVVVMLAACGAGSGTLAPSQRSSQKSDLGVMPAPTMAPAAGGAAAPNVAEPPAQAGGLPLPTGQVAVPGYERRIIKNAELSLQVKDSGAAIDQVTGLATEYNGYILTSRTWYEDGYRLASVTVSVPSDSFEEVLRRLRGLASKVLSEQATGQDVTNQYVDLQARQKNLEATAARIRSFLDQTTNVTDALEVNRQLSDIEGQIEQVKGQLQYLSARSAYSNINVSLEPERPTPTPTPMPAWQPGSTFNEATGALGVILRVLGDLVIWCAVVLLPFLVPLAIVIWLLIRLSRRRSQHKGRSQSQTPDAG